MTTDQSDTPSAAPSSRGDAVGATGGWRPGVAERLGYYVYLLIDPRAGEVFYVGKGVGGRCFAHVAQARGTAAKRVGEFERLDRIRAIGEAGHQVQVEVLRHGLDEASAFAVEAAAIDLLGLDLLTNRVAGHNTDTHGRMGVDDINALYAATPIDIDPTHRVVLIRVAREWRPGISQDALYDATRRWWRIDKRRRTLGHPRAPQWALAVAHGVVRAVYRIDGWEPAPDEVTAANPTALGRWGFVGVRDPDLEARYLMSDVTAYLPAAAQNPIRYLNC